MSVPYTDSWDRSLLGGRWKLLVRESGTAPQLHMTEVGQDALPCSQQITVIFVCSFFPPHTLSCNCPSIINCTCHHGFLPPTPPWHLSRAALNSSSQAAALSRLHPKNTRNPPKHHFYSSAGVETSKLATALPYSLNQEVWACLPSPVPPMKQTLSSSWI